MRISAITAGFVGLVLVGGCKDDEKFAAEQRLDLERLASAVVEVRDVPEFIDLKNANDIEFGKRSEALVRNFERPVIVVGYVDKVAEKKEISDITRYNVKLAPTFSSYVLSEIALNGMRLFGEEFAEGFKSELGLGIAETINYWVNASCWALDSAGQSQIESLKEGELVMLSGVVKELGSQRVEIYNCQLIGQGSL